MIYSRSAEYAVRALTNLASHPELTQKMARQIAEEEKLPVYFLAKTLQQLARKGLLRSTKGPNGGFGLNRPARKITLQDVVEALDGPKVRAHWPDDPFFQPSRKELLRYLRRTTIADLAGARTGAKSRSAARRPKAREAAARGDAP
jgi:Rrf2 family protein